MPYLSSCNIACGGHAGNDEVMVESIKNAKSHNLSIGAHPGYPDKKNFGRVTLDLPTSDLVESLDGQLESFLKHASTLNAQCSHIKLHGALYNDLEHHSELRNSVICLLKQKYASLKVFGLAGGKFEQNCKEQSLNFIPEGFIDRTYQENGLLTPRIKSGSLIKDPQLAAKQAELIATGKSVLSLGGQPVRINAQTLCVHGDGENALKTLQAVFTALEKAKVKIAAPK